MESLKYVRDYKVAPLLNSMVLHLLVTKPPTDREILGSLIDYLAALEEDGDYKERVVNRRISIHRQPAKPRRREPSKDDDASKSEAEGKPPATSNGAAADGEAKAEDLKEDTKEDSVNDDPSQEGATNGTKPDDDADESKDESKHDAKEESKDDAKDESKDDAKEESKDDAKEDAKDESKDDAKDESKEESKDDAKEESKEEESKEEPKEEEARAAEPKAEEMASRAAPTPLARVSGTLIVTVVRARDVPDLDAIGGSDPYCVLRCTEGDAQEQRTAVKSDATDPVWDERFTFAIRDSAAQRIAVRMLDEDTFSDAPIAEGTVGLGDLTDGEDTERWVALGGEHGTVQVLVRLRAEGFGEVPPVTNRAFLFVKPHAVTHPTLQLVEARMAEAGLRVLRRGSVPAQRIDEEGIIDRHYSAIARYALQWGADELVLDRAAKEKFSAAFGVSWNDAVEAGDVLNAGAAMKRGVAGATTPEALGEAWDAAETKTKLMPGLYAGRLADKYVCNGFYPRNRAKFTAPGSEVQWYDVEWDEAAMTWAAFRGDFLGPTDPARAAPGSLRGTILRDWEALGLSAAPSVSDNGVHASAGPVEGMVERHVWLEQPRESDPFARLCTTRGVGADVVDRVAANAEITVDGRTAPAFDLLEDVQTSAVLEMLRSMAP